MSGKKKTPVKEYEREAMKINIDILELDLKKKEDSLNVIAENTDME